MFVCCYCQICTECFAEIQFCHFKIDSSLELLLFVALSVIYYIAVVVLAAFVVYHWTRTMFADISKEIKVYLDKIIIIL